jgi:hypothetical protein
MAARVKWGCLPDVHGDGGGLCWLVMPKFVLAHSRWARVAVVAAVAFGGPLTSSAAATSWTVNTTSDPSGAGECGTGQCSLRQAIAVAQPGDTVSLPASATPYAVTLGVIDVTNAITISGAAANTTTIEGNGSSQIFDVSGLAASSTLTISGVTISGGDALGLAPDSGDADGGAIDADAPGATVALSSVTLSGNTAGVAGGAIELSAGDMTITDSTLGPGNLASGNSDFYGTGGAIDNDNGTLTITDSTISGNTAGSGLDAVGEGGGISDESSGVTGTTALQFDTIAFNTATGLAGTAGGDLYSGTDDPDGFSVGETITADGAAPTGGDCGGNGFLSSGYNLTDAIAAQGSGACSFGNTGDVLGDARLGPLIDNGGPTDTDALAAGSPAINIVPAVDCTSTDQRGVSRGSGATTCDAGALEAGGGETAPQWSVAHDFLASPNEANPSPDSLGNSDVWSYEETPVADVGTPADYTLLPDFGVNQSCGILNTWSDPSDFPELNFNAGTSTGTCYTGTYPAQSMDISPANSADGIVAWTSPVTGTISVAGSFISLDHTSGSGTTWAVYDGSVLLTSGTNDVGGSGNFDPPAFSLTKGDTLYFLLGPPSDNDASYDTTEVSLTITEAPPPPPPPPSPTATTLAASNVTSDSATFNGTVNPEGTATSADFEWGTTTSYGTTTSAQSLGSGSSALPVSAQLTGLSPGTTYHFQLYANGTIGGGDLSFSTPAVTPPPCATSMTIDAVEVLAGCITEQSGGTYLATGDTSFGDGASIVNAGTSTPAELVLDPSSHEISIASTSGGGAQSGELEAGGLDVATGDLVIHTDGQTDPISGLAGAASVSGMSSIDVTLSGWSLDDSGVVAPAVYLAPSSDGGGAIVDGQLALPAWLGNALEFGTLATEGLVTGVSGQLAVQANSSGQLSVIDGGISFKASVLGSPIQLANGELSYQRAGDEWTGSAYLGYASLAKLQVNGTISDGKLDDLGVDFSCATSKVCGLDGTIPTLGAVLDVKDVDLNMINLQGISYTPVVFGAPIHVCVPRFESCPPPQPAPQIDGAIILGVFGDRILVGGNFDYLLDGQFSATGAVGLAPLYGSKFSDPGPLAPGQSASNAVDNLLSSGYAGVELASAAINFTPPNLLQATGTMDLPPLPFPVQFLKGTISIGIEPPHFTGEGSLTLVVPSYVPLIHGDTFGGVEALVSDEAAAAEASLPQYCASVNLGFHTYTECTPKITFLAAFNWTTGHVTVDMNGGNINDYATVPLLSATDARAGAVHVVKVPAGKQLASFTVKSAKGTPDVELIGPRVAGHRRHLMLATSKRFGNRSGALASVDRRAHSESFLVLVPSGGRWTVKRLRGPQITSVKVTVPRAKLKPSRPYPLAVERAGDLPKGAVSTDGKLTLHYSVPNAGSGTTVDVWAGTAPHGAGGVMIADGLPPSGAATWKLSGLASGRYYPYAIVSQNGVPVSIQYWPGSVEIVNASAPPTPTGVQASLSDQPPYALATRQVYVTWNQVQSSSTYAITATPLGGGKPVVDAVPATQIADLLSLTPGRWSITVAAVDSADDASLPSSSVYATVT